MLTDLVMETKHTTTRSRFLGIPFWGGNSEKLLEEADLQGGLLTVPSAPSLAEMGRDPFRRQTYSESDWAVMDGGYVALVLRVFFGRHWPRISGLQLLEKLLGANGHPRAIPFEKRRVLWVMPSAEEEARVRRMLAGFGLPEAEQHFYQAPVYRTRGDFDDADLLARVTRCAPDWVVLGIGGGKQEKLGYQLREALRRESGPMPAILCTGGAIAFLSGGEARIPSWADRLYLGWLLRVIDDPRTFLKRYWNAGWQFPRLLWEERGQLFSTEERAVPAPRRVRPKVQMGAKGL